MTIDTENRILLTEDKQVKLNLKTKFCKCTILFINRNIRTFLIYSFVLCLNMTNLLLFFSCIAAVYQFQLKLSKLLENMFLPLRLTVVRTSLQPGHASFYGCNTLKPDNTKYFINSFRSNNHL